MPAKLFPILFILLSLSGKKATNINEAEKKKTFIKIAGFAKLNQVDSLKEYLPDQYEDDSADFSINIDNAKLLFKNSNFHYTVDSIKLTDSSFVLGVNAEIYYYSLIFCQDTVYEGSITIGFYGAVSDQAANISV